MEDLETYIEAIVLNIKDHIENPIYDESQILYYRREIKKYCRMEGGFFYFIRHVLGYDKVKEDPHKRWADKHIDDFFTYKRIMRLKPRGTYKTTIYGISFILYLWAIYSPQIRFVYTSSSEALLNEVHDEFKRFLDPKHISIFSVLFGIRLDDENKNTTSVINIEGREGKGFSMNLRTAGSSLTGTHPNVIVVDDPCNEKDRDQKPIRERRKRWVSSWVPLLSPLEIDINGVNFEIKHILISATRYHLDDCLGVIIKGNEKDSQKEKYDIEIEGIRTDGHPTYPDFLPEEEIQKIESELEDDPVYLACQYYNDPLPDALTVFVKEKMTFRSLGEISPMEKGLNYLFFDPSQGKQESDFPASIFVNHKEANGDNPESASIFDAVDKKIRIEDLIPQLCVMAMNYNVVKIVYEDNGTNLIGKYFTDGLAAIGYNCAVEGIHETRNKEERIKLAAPVVMSSKVIFRSDYATAYPELMNQVLFFPAWGNDDFPDVIEKAVKTLIKRREPNLRFI